MTSKFVSNTLSYIKDFMYEGESLDDSLLLDYIEKSSKRRQELMDLVGEDGRYVIDANFEIDEPLFESLVSNFQKERGVRFLVLTKKISLKEWRTNRIEEPFFVPPLGLEVPKGVRVTKAIKMILEADGRDSEYIEKVITSYSEVLNEVSVKGKLIVSANPFDIATIGLGKSWRTCFTPGRSHEIAPLSYMGDGRTMVAFLISEGDYKDFLEHRPVLKRWRKLFFLEHTGKKVLLASKGYPYHSENLTNESISAILNLVFGSEVSEVIKTPNRGDLSFRRLEPRAQIFSDIGNGDSKLEENEILIAGEETSEKLRFRGGVVVPCFSCGKRASLEYCPSCHTCLTKIEDEGK